MNPEAPELNPDILNEHVSDTLFQIRSELVRLVFTPEVLTPEIVDSIEQRLDRLRDMAEKTGDKVKEEILSKLGIRFYSLHTVGIVDDRRKFESEAFHAFDILNTTLLCWDGMVAKNKGKIMTLIKEERERD